MAPDNSELERYYERFNRDHQRLRGELLDSLPTSVAKETRFRGWFPGILRWPAMLKPGYQLAGFAGFAAVGFAAVVITIVALRDSGASVSFADVLTRVERVRSVQYTQTMVKPVGFLKPVRVFVSGRYLQRQEHLGPDGRVLIVDIKNFQTGTYVTIDPRNKRFTILSRQRTILPDGSEEVTEIKPAPSAKLESSADIFKMVAELPPDAVPAFSERVLDGRKVIGFYREYRQGVYLWKNTYWVDVVTMLPVRIETSAITNDKVWGSGEWILSNFVFDEKLDPRLFSTEPPEGYSVEESEIQGFRMPEE